MKAFLFLFKIIITLPYIPFLPYFYSLFYKISGGTRRLVSRNSHLCLEGFPRSANSFAFNQFIINNSGVLVARHVHTMYQIKNAIDLGIPTLVLIRHPEQSIKSFSSMYPGRLNSSLLLISYIIYYRCLNRFCGKCVLSDFSVTCSELQLVILELNKFYGCSFAEPLDDSGAIAKKNLTVFFEQGKGIARLNPLGSVFSKSPAELNPFLLHHAELAYLAVKSYSLYTSS